MKCFNIILISILFCSLSINLGAQPWHRAAKLAFDRYAKSMQKKGIYLYDLDGDMIKRRLQRRLNSKASSLDVESAVTEALSNHSIESVD
jgi:hypothetical protein